MDQRRETTSGRERAAASEPFEITVSLFRTEDEARAALEVVSEALRALPGLEHVEPALSRVA